MDCLSLRVTIGRDGEDVDVRVESPAGEAKGQLLRGRIEPLASSLEASRPRAPDPATSQAIGRALFEALFSGPVGDLYRTSLGMARAAGTCLDLSLRCEVADLAEMPWELLWDPLEQRFLAASPEVFFTRNVPVPKPLRPPVSPPLRVLLVSAEPSGLPPLDTEGESARVQALLDPMVKSGQMVVQTLSHATPELLREALRRGPHLVHVMCHGRRAADGEGELMLEDGYGDPLSLSAAELAAMLDGTAVRLVVLMACETAAAGTTAGLDGMGPALVWAGVGGVVTLQWELPDRVAPRLSGALYQELAAGQPLGAAINAARRAAYVAGGREGGDWSALVAHTRDPGLRLVAPPKDVHPTQAWSQPKARRPLVGRSTTALIILLAIVFGGLGYGAATRLAAAPSTNLGSPTPGASGSPLAAVSAIPSAMPSPVAGTPTPRPSGTPLSTPLASATSPAMATVSAFLTAGPTSGSRTPTTPPSRSPLVTPSATRPAVVSSTPSTGTVLRKDDFSDPANPALVPYSPYPAQMGVGYDSGEYFIRRLDPTWSPAIYMEQLGSPDVTLSIDARLVGSPTNADILLFCRTDSSFTAGYEVRVAPSALSVTILRRGADKQETPLTQPQVSRAILPPYSRNHLVGCIGDTIAVRINGQQVAVARDGTYRDGRLAIGVGGPVPATEALEARFDNLVVSAPD